MKAQKQFDKEVVTDEPPVHTVTPTENPKPTKPKDK